MNHHPRACEGTKSKKKSQLRSIFSQATTREFTRLELHRIRTSMVEYTLPQAWHGNSTASYSYRIIIVIIIIIIIFSPLSHPSRTRSHIFYCQVSHKRLSRSVGVAVFWFSVRESSKKRGTVMIRRAKSCVCPLVFSC